MSRAFWMLAAGAAAACLLASRRSLRGAAAYAAPQLEPQDPPGASPADVPTDSPNAAERLPPAGVGGGLPAQAHIEPLSDTQEFLRGA